MEADGNKAISDDAAVRRLPGQMGGFGQQGEGAQVRINLVEELGADAYAYGRLADESGTLETVVTEKADDDEDASSDTIVMRADGRTPPRAGETVWMVPKVEHVHLFDAATGDRLPDAG